MGIPQIPDQIRRAPAEVLRAVFAGIGRVLLAADRPGPTPTRMQPQPGTASSAAHGARQQRDEVARPAAESRWRSLDQTGNVRLLTADELYDDLGGTAAAPAVSDDNHTAADGPDDNHTAAPADHDAVASSGSPALPLADYDSLSLASIRARLRTLNADQLRVLASYERKNAERTDVLGMLERRIEKLERGG